MVLSLLMYSMLSNPNICRLRPTSNEDLGQETCQTDMCQCTSRSKTDSMDNLCMVLKIRNTGRDKIIVSYAT